MNEILSNIREIATFIRDFGLIIAVPTIFAIFAVGVKLYRQHVAVLKDQIEGLKLTQVDHVLIQMKAQKEVFALEKDRLEREIVEFRKYGADKKQELDIVQRSLNMVQHKLQLIEEKRREVTDQISERSLKIDMNIVSSEFESEILRKLRMWCNSESYGTPGTIIQDYLFCSSTYGEVAVSEIEQLIMIRKGWIEEVENGVRITEKGRQAASVK